MQSKRLPSSCLSLASNPDNIALLEPFVQALQYKYGIDENQYYNILLVLTEAVNNGILHGNCGNPNKLVNVNLCKRGRSLLEFTVTDEGNGFDPANLADPTCKERLCEPNGRGVFLMQQLSHSLRYCDNGRKVVFRFKLNQ